MTHVPTFSLARFKGAYLALMAGGALLSALALFGGGSTVTFLGPVVLSVGGLWGLARITGRWAVVSAVGLLPILGPVAGLFLFWLEDLLVRRQFAKASIRFALALIVLPVCSFALWIAWLLTLQLGPCCAQD